MSGARLKKPEAYSLEYAEVFSEPSTRQMPADRLLHQNGMIQAGF
jgi:hypothetical protein